MQYHVSGLISYKALMSCMYQIPLEGESQEYQHAGHTVAVNEADAIT